MGRVEPDSSAQREPPNKIDPDGLNENCSLRKLPRSSPAPAGVAWSQQCVGRRGGRETCVSAQRLRPFSNKACAKGELYFFSHILTYTLNHTFFFFIEFYIGYIKKALFEFHLKQTTNAGVITLKRVSSGDGGLGEGVLVSTSSYEEEFGT